MKSRRKLKSLAGQQEPQKGQTETFWLDDDSDTEWPDEEFESIEGAAIRCDTRQLRTRHAIEAALEELALKAAIEDFPEYRILR